MLDSITTHHINNQDIPLVIFLINRKINLQSENYDTLLGFNMETYRSSKMLWKACVEHHTFFRLHSPKLPRRFTLSLGSKFMYSGRTEFQTVEDMKQRGRLERKFVRSPSKILVGECDKMLVNNLV